MPPTEKRGKQSQPKKKAHCICITTCTCTSKLLNSYTSYPVGHIARTTCKGKSLSKTKESRHSEERLTLHVHSLYVHVLTKCSIALCPVPEGRIASTS